MTYPLFTSESVAAGHPDKLCDQVSDAILDAALEQDPSSRVAVEALATAGRLIIAGEVTSAAELDFEQIARDVIMDLGYTVEDWGFWHASPIDVYVHQQAEEIAVGVEQDGAGDQGMMFGYACRETPELMPLPIMLAHSLVRAMDQARSTGDLPFLRPDGKSQVVVRYESDRPVAVEHVTLAVPIDPHVSKATAHGALFERVVVPTLARYGMEVGSDRLVVNGTGVWTIGGPASDTGLTGRKVVVDTYGGMARTGGGALSGKDPTKVDRSGAYAARYLAQNVVRHGYADRCEVQLAYVIGRPEPIARAIETFGTAHAAQEEIERFAWDLLDLSVAGVIRGLDLRRPIYRDTAAYGHFGRPEFPWEHDYARRRRAVA